MKKGEKTICACLHHFSLLADEKYAGRTLTQSTASAERESERRKVCCHGQLSSKQTHSQSAFFTFGFLGLLATKKKRERKNQMRSEPATRYTLSNGLVVKSGRRTQMLLSTFDRREKGEKCNMEIKK